MLVERRNILNYLSTNIKYLRQQKGLTQEDVAKVVGKVRSLISAWEADEREISVEDIIKLSAFFQVSMENLVGKDLRIKDNGEQKQTMKFGDVEVTLSKNGEITDKDILEMNQFLMQEKIKNKEN